MQIGLSIHHFAAAKYTILKGFFYSQTEVKPLLLHWHPVQSLNIKSVAAQQVFLHVYPGRQKPLNSLRIRRILRVMSFKLMYCSIEV